MPGAKQGVSISRMVMEALGRSIVCVVVMTGAVGCDVNRALQDVAEARRLSDDLLVEFTKASDAANRAVMADTDESSVVFAREAEAATSAVQRDVEVLKPLLANLGFSQEADRLEDFRARFAEYRKLDRSILDLAVENTNLKAQQLSFGPAHDAVDALRDALNGVRPSNPSETWHVNALAASIVGSARDIESSQAPHIAEAGEPAMAGIEARMNQAEATAREALRSLKELAPPPPKHSSPPPKPHSAS